MVGNKIAIITEGKFDADVVNAILHKRHLQADYRVVDAGGYSAALSKARTILSLGKERVLLLLDTDSADPTAIAERRQFVDTYISSNSYKDRVRTIWSIPEFERIFLENKHFVQKISPKPLDGNMLELGKDTPKKMLQILGVTESDYFRLLDDTQVADDFFATGPIKEMVDFIEA